MGKIVASFVLGLAAASAQAIQVVPTSYAMPNGFIGGTSYLDDTYTGSGCRTCAGSALSGGLGDLTDGIVATGNWDTQAVRYVGWNSNPTVTFTFAASTTVNSVTFYFDDAAGYGGVRPPTSVSIAGQTYAVVDPNTGSAAPFAFTVNGLSLPGTSIPVLFSRTGGSGAFMVSEVTFDGVVSAVPEPSQWAMLLLGLTFAGSVAFRRQSSI